MTWSRRPKDRICWQWKGWQITIMLPLPDSADSVESGLLIAHRTQHDDKLTIPFCRNEDEMRQKVYLFGDLLYTWEEITWGTYPTSEDLRTNDDLAEELLIMLGQPDYYAE